MYIYITYVCVLSCFSHVRLFVTPWIGACQAPLAMDSLGKNELLNKWSRLPCPPLGDLPLGFPDGTSGKEPVCQCGRHKGHGFNLWVGKIP